MAEKAINPKADQPRFTSKDLTKTEPSLQYRVQGIKTPARSMARMTQRKTSR